MSELLSLILQSNILLNDIIVNIVMPYIPIFESNHLEQMLVLSYCRRCDFIITNWVLTCDRYKHFLKVIPGERRPDSEDRLNGPGDEEDRDDEAICLAVERWWQEMISHLDQSIYGWELAHSLTIAYEDKVHTFDVKLVIEDWSKFADGHHWYDESEYTDGEKSQATYDITTITWRYLLYVLEKVVRYDAYSDSNKYQIWIRNEDVFHPIIELCPVTT